MTEIELKARVDDPGRVADAVASFASFAGETVKKDTYYRLRGVEGIPSGAAFAASSVVFTFLAALAAAAVVIAGASKTVAALICLFAAAFVSAAAILASRRGGRERPVKVRVREEAGATTVTYKRKETRGQVEVNDEREFSIDDRAAFESFIGDVGFETDSVKEKKTRRWTCRTDGGFDATLELSLVGPLGWFVEIEIMLDAPDAAGTERATEALRALLAKCGVGEGAIETRYYTELLAELGPDRSQAPEK